MVGMVDGLVRCLKVYLRALLLQGLRQKAVAERHALLSLGGSAVSIYYL